jgi:uncharacterized protein (TIGR00725 family)
MGKGDAAGAGDVATAEQLGALVAGEGWVVLTGGRPAGVMAAAYRGAKRVPGSLTIGILPAEAGPVAEGVDIAIFTGMGSGRNQINVLSSDVIVACGRGGAGTASEIALALKAGKPVVLVGATPEAIAFFHQLGGAGVTAVPTPEAAVAAIQRILAAAR